ncbi:PREDICTED: uncharacterized protein LOC104768479 isoform X3 [Camelina sativa]|uniref:Uncharacterized protein LOC104768479 isoform X1 n=1 Tax=Camelina sativa TaxID=90675 RepID=A0ABM0XTD6_CAMSA|nr:PREDICTED: uncharacterized protein LOC104768479 isoform X1 [Camelina sativa]XP_010490779.1 PREDICTED: uncharacterized protein LOC104768479 isoform X3 [Camelina sativa]
MMLSRRPVSSPGRVEKYPPPFMGFLRSKSNGGSTSRSRSRGRSRASPLFVRRNKSAAAVAQEPSSPKVTCMGQVRVNRSKPKIKPESRDNPTRRRCKWMQNASFNKFAGKIKTLSFWPNCRLFSFLCSRPEVKEKDSPISQLDRPATEPVQEIKDEIVEVEEKFENPKLCVSPATTPPIDALLLTRSRSAPYRSSSLAFRFWEENNQRAAESQRSEKTESEIPTEKINSVSESENIDSDEVEITFIQRPVLTRSKSEPARIGREDDGVTSE